MYNPILAWKPPNDKLAITVLCVYRREQRRLGTLFGEPHFCQRRKVRPADFAFVTLETVNDGVWSQVAGTYDGTSLRVYIKGKPAHRICTTDPESGEEKTECGPAPKPKCSVDSEWVPADPESGIEEGMYYDRAVCVKGSIINNQDVFIGAFDPPSSNDQLRMLDEVRISNYAKRDFEVAASARHYSAYTQVLGQEVAMSNSASNDTSSYDLLGRAVTTQRTMHPKDPAVVLPIPPFVARTAFDSLGRARSLSYPDGEVVVSTYDRGGIQTQLIGYGNLEGPLGAQYGKQPYLTSARVTVTGRIAELGFGNGVETTFRYDDGPTKIPGTSGGGVNKNGTFGNELLSEQVTVLPAFGASPVREVVQDQTYTYDPLGNLLSRKDYARPASGTQPGSGSPPAQHENPLTATYTYDDLSRLLSFESSFESPLGAIVVAGSGTYEYDKLGNMTAKEGANLKVRQGRRPR